ncbi:MAG: alpha-amylase family glycosyl hydrolase [Paludibacteraceae bacterium]|nr:alpha-amylase family glycosyl hydrolase [Paludibacteraceae bacterium]
MKNEMNRALVAKKNIILTLLLVPAALAFAAPQVQQVEPLCWWTDMTCPLTLMLHGTDLADAQVTVSQQNAKGRWITPTQGLVVTGQHNAQSPNYLFVDLDVKQAGNYRFTLTKGNKRTTVDYTIHPRRDGSRERQSFTSADVIYLIMSDRFVDGDETNNSTKNTIEKCDKSNVNGRWGGDIQGIIDSLDHIAQLGATAIWPTPLLGDNEAEWSYHGYACSDYYHIDPRYGTNELYCQLVREAHAKGIKMLMDMVPNHCGGSHWWMKDLPYQDWINQFPTFTRTPNNFTANYDINASQYDRQLSNRGWFDYPMPDMNLENPDLLKYFQQWAIWWIEYANLDGLRVDTYPYIEKVPGAQWLKAIRDEYPNINIVGECWTRPTPAVAYWQSGTKNFDGFDSNLPTVMDFPTEEAIRQALENDGNFYDGGLMRVYNTLTMDYLYGDVNNLLLFVGNHDMDRFADVVKDGDMRRVLLGHIMVATMRGIPQIFAGDEYGCKSADRSKGHSTLRMPLPDESTLTAEQRNLYDNIVKIYRFRKSEPIIHNGKTMHFMARDNTYGYFRYTDEGAVFVYINAAEENRTIPTDHYAEILNKYNPIGKDILTGSVYDLRRTDIVVPALSAIVVRLSR